MTISIPERGPTAIPTPYQPITGKPVNLPKPTPRTPETPAQRRARELFERARAERTATARANAADPYGGLVGEDRDAAAALTELFKSYGLDSLAPQIIKMIQNGFSADTISIELQQTKEYKKRFAANERRLKAGMSVLSPAEYISTERAYRQLMSQAGLPIGFYDQTSDFENLLASDVSPTEVKGRIDSVTEAINKAPASTVDYFKQFYNTGDMVAFALDPKRAQPLIDQRIKAAEAAAIASTQGFNLGQSQAERIGSTGASLQDLQTGVGFIGQESQTTSKLSNIYGGDDVTTDDLVNEIFQNDAAAGAKRKKLASQERATFSGSGSQTKGSLNRTSDGNI